VSISFLIAKHCAVLNAGSASLNVAIRFWGVGAEAQDASVRDATEATMAKRQRRAGTFCLFCNMLKFP
jgi:hypothetical protein